MISGARPPGAPPPCAASRGRCSVRPTDQARLSASPRIPTGGRGHAGPRLDCAPSGPGPSMVPFAQATAPRCCLDRGAALPFRREVPARSVAAAPAAAAPAPASVQHPQGDDEQGGKHCRRDKPWSSVAGREIAHVDHLPWNPCPPRRHPCAAKVATSPTLPWAAVPSILGMAAWRRPAAPAGPG